MAGPQAIAAPLPHMPLSGERLAAALRGIDNAPRPQGMDPAMFESLRAALRDSLSANDRSASQPPTGEVNVIDDLTVQDLGGGAADLTWTYKNVGDYDLNGEVNISDLTQIGIHFGKTTAHPQWDTAQRADGDANGEVNVSDVTPIGLHFSAQVAQFHLYGADAAEGPWSYIAALPFDAGNFSVYPPQFTWHLAQADKPFYLVAPADIEGFDSLTATGGTAAAYTPGTVTELAQATIGVDGGVLDGPLASALEGVQVEVPAGAFPGDAEVSLGVDSGSIIPATGEWEGEILDVATGLTELLAEPIEITMPYTGGEDFIPVPYYIDEDGDLEACIITDWDPAAGEVTFETWHSSRYTLIKAARQAALRPAFDTGWEVGLDGFQIVNLGGTYTPGGNCWGMSTFSRWYWCKHSRGGEPVLFPSFMQHVGDKTGQDIIAMRAQLSLVRVFQRYALEFIDSTEPFDDEDTYLIIRHQLQNTGMPVVLYIVSDKGAAHAILAYAYGRDTLKVYDPNTPGELHELQFDELGFSPFLNANHIFVSFRYFGTGSLKTDAFEDILADAKAGFAAGEVPLEVVTNDDGHGGRTVAVNCFPDNTSGEIVRMRVTAVDRNSGSVTVLEAAPYAGSDQFSFSFPLHTGETELWFETFAQSGKGELVKRFNSLENLPVKIASAAPPTSIHATLTWFRPDDREDLELVMVDPTGDVCWKESSQTDDGAYLYVRDEAPGCIENIALEVRAATTTRWGQPYTFRVLNTGPFQQDFVLSISLNDGLEREYAGYVAGWEGPWDWPLDPVTDTGAMWWDGPTITPVQP